MMAYTEIDTHRLGKSLTHKQVRTSPYYAHESAKMSLPVHYRLTDFIFEGVDADTAL